MERNPDPKKIRRLREDRAWTQERLAAVAGIDTRTVQRIESGRSAFPDTLMALANAFEIDIAELIQTSKQEPEQAEQKRDGEEEKKNPREPRIVFLLRISSGKELFDIVGGVDGCSLENDELGDEGEVDSVGDFLQGLSDWADMWNDIGPKDRIKAAYEYTEKIRELEEMGLWIFAGQNVRKLQGANTEVFKMTLGYVSVLRSDNPRIVKPSALRSQFLDRPDLHALEDKVREFVAVALPEKVQFV